MDFVQVFVSAFDSIKDFLMTIVDLLLFLPNFVTNAISIFPTDIQVLFGTILGIICIALIYRFIR